jgi:ABC-type transport system substrate-binding protein
MQAQASTVNLKKRKQIFDHVQEIVSDQQPFIYLVHKNSLSAVARSIRGPDPVALSPQTYWDIEQMSVTSERAAK